MRAVPGIPFACPGTIVVEYGLLGPRPEACDHGSALRRSCHQPRARLRWPAGWLERVLLAAIDV